MMYRLLNIILAFIFSLSLGVTAGERTDSLSPADAAGDNLVVSLLTCAPGPQVYELCGHSAIRIRNAEMDSVWNYGIFDFEAPNFLYRFCKGETDYMVCGYPTEYFFPVYMRRGSKVTEQVLDLTQREARILLGMLRTEALPENRVYRYNYVRDNCATRPWQRISEAIAFASSAASSGSAASHADEVSRDGRILMPDTLYFSSFREEMRHFHKNYPWYQFGIDLALGSSIDKPLQKDEDIFAPPILAEKASRAFIRRVHADTISPEVSFQDEGFVQTSVSGHDEGSVSPLVSSTGVLVAGYPDATLPATPWYLTPAFAGAVILILSILAFILRKRYSSLARLWISIYFIAAGLAGCVVAFLVFFSEHEGTSSNWLILWLNPLQWIIGAGVWIPSWRKAVREMARYDISIGTIILILRLISLLGVSSRIAEISGQLENPAILLMALSLIPLSLSLLFKSSALARKNPPSVSPGKNPSSEVSGKNKFPSKSTCVSAAARISK